MDATDSRYGFSSKDLRQLGGSEISRIDDLIGSDHGECPKNFVVNLPVIIARVL